LGKCLRKFRLGLPNSVRASWHLGCPWSSLRAYTLEDALEEVLDRRWVKHFAKRDRIGLKRIPPDRPPPTGTARSTDNTSGHSQVNSRFTMADVGVALRAPGAAGIPAALQPASMPASASHYLGLD
jgi:hypothetical protein